MEDDFTTHQQLLDFIESEFFHVQSDEDVS